MIITPPLFVFPKLLIFFSSWPIRKSVQRGRAGLTIHSLKPLKSSSPLVFVLVFLFVFVFVFVFVSSLDIVFLFQPIAR